MEFLIDTQVVSKHNNITKIMPVVHYKKNVDNLIKITAGNRAADNNILNKLTIYELEYEDLVIFHQSNNLHETLLTYNINYL